MIVVREGADHARLVHRAHGALGGVGRQQAGSADDPGAGVLFHDHGDVRAALAAPAGQALEPIEDLVVSTDLEKRWIPNMVENLA